MLLAGSKNFNILAFAGLFAIATTVGGVLLTDAVDLGEVGLKQGASSASAQLQQLTSTPDEGNSRLLLEIVLGLFGVTATGVGMFSIACFHTTPSRISLAKSPNLIVPAVMSPNVLILSPWDTRNASTPKLLQL